MFRTKFNLMMAAMAYLAADPAVSGTDTLATATGTPAEPAAPTASSPFVTMLKQTFHFKTEKMRDEKGAVVGEGKKIPKTDLFLPVPKEDRLKEILDNLEGKFSKEKELLMGAVVDVIYGVARGQINDFRETAAGKEATAITATVLNYDKLDWTAIANMPKSERGTSVPSDEDIQAFLDSYLAVMPEALNKSKDKIENHVALFKAGFKKQRGQKDFLEVFSNALLVYVGAVPEDVLEEQSPVVEYYSNRLERMLKAEEKITMDDI